MRLLNATTHELEVFYEPDIPPYAILSHRWEHDEVLLSDIQNGVHEQKHGWEKIKNSCQLAIDSSLDYVWVDTCCIDKTSSAELSEAINSMFRWYAYSEICYAFLCDVPIEVQIPFSGLSHDHFAKSEWFSRGWTLQELIAPAKLTFYDRRWFSLGTRDEHGDLLSTRFGIPKRLLCRDSDYQNLVSMLRDCSAAQKMSWAAERNTTRIEDRAYSLLGLFDVNMPLLYGEGARAFTRLQEDILRTETDLSLIAWGNRIKLIPDYDYLLASSPDDFSDCGKIIRSNRIESSGRFMTLSMTNIGLRIDGAYVLETGSHGALAVDLGCHRSGDVEGTLALPVQSAAAMTEGSNLLDNKGHLQPVGRLRSTLYYPGDLYGMSWSTRVKRYDTSSETTMMDLTIARRMNRSYWTRYDKTLPYTHLWVKISLPMWWRVRKLSPAEFWDKDKLMLHLSRTKDGRDSSSMILNSNLRSYEVDLEYSYPCSAPTKGIGLVIETSIPDKPDSQPRESHLRVCLSDNTRSTRTAWHSISRRYGTFLKIGAFRFKISITDLTRGTDVVGALDVDFQDSWKEEDQTMYELEAAEPLKNVDSGSGLHVPPTLPTQRSRPELRLLADMVRQSSSISELEALPAKSIHPTQTEKERLGQWIQAQMEGAYNTKFAVDGLQKIEQLSNHLSDPCGGPGSP